MLNILPYLGKRADTSFGKTTQVVLDVGKGYLRKGHYFFTDNYYTSVELMMTLEKRNTLLCCTVNSNRVSLSSDMKKTCAAVKKLKRGDSLKRMKGRMKGRMLAVTWMDTRVVNLLKRGDSLKWMKGRMLAVTWMDTRVVNLLKRGDSLKWMKGRMLAVTWMDTRVVNLLKRGDSLKWMKGRMLAVTWMDTRVVNLLKRGDSLKRMKGRMLAVTWMDTRVVNLLCNLPNCLGDSDVRSRDKKQRDIEISVSRPRAIELYNDSMGGVELSDQLVASYRRHMKLYTWYLQVFFHLVQLSADAMCACVLFHVSTGITTSCNMLTVTRAKLMQLQLENAEHWILPWILPCIHIGVVVCSCQKPIKI